MVDLEARDMGALKLTVDRQGIVWELVGSRLPKTSGMDVTAYLQQPRYSSDYSVRVVGSPANAAIIVELYQRRLKQEFQSLEVCSPLCCLDPADRDDPAVMLYSMRKFRRSPSLGGWHEFEIKDLPSYLLSIFYADVAKSMDLQEAKRYPANFALDILYHHPAWPYISFVEGVDLEQTGELISLILDPRWYADPLAEAVEGRQLEQFLGLYPGISSEKTSTRSRRFRMVLGCWKNSGGSALKADGPRGFVWRVWAAKGGGER